VQCPRCGYDLRGEVASWRDACPLAGRCGECGLAFGWPELLSSTVGLPAWVVEFAPAARLTGATVRTMAGPLRPWRFWTSVRMTHPLRGRRLAWHVAMLLAVAYLLFVAGHVTVIDASVRRNFGPAGWATTGATRLEILLSAALLPGSTEPLCTITTVRGTWSWSSSADMVRNYWSPILHGATGLLAMAAIGPLVLAGLRASRRLAGVRGLHLVRLGVYSLGWATLVWTIMVTQNAARYVLVGRGGWAVPLFWTFDRLMFVGVISWFGLWWMAGIGQYLQMQHAGAVAAAVTAIAVLGAVAMLTVTCPDLANYLFKIAGLVNV